MRVTDEEYRPAHRVRAVRVEGKRIVLKLWDGRVLTVPLSFYPAVRDASPADQQNCNAFGDGYCIEWPTLDYQLSSASVLLGCREPPTYAAWRKRRPIGSHLVIEEPLPKRRARRKSAARKPSTTRRKTKHSANRR